MSDYNSTPSAPLRPFPEAITGKLDDYMIKNCTLENVKEPFLLPTPPAMGFFNSTAEFCDAQIKGIAEHFREEMAHATQISGTKVPSEQFLHCRFKSASKMTLNITNKGSVASGNLAVMQMGPFTDMEKFPEDSQKAVYSKHMLLIQVQTSDERMENAGLVFCDAMSKKDGVLVRASLEVLEGIKKFVDSVKGNVGKNMVVIRKLKKFDWMSLGPVISLQEIARAQESNKDLKTPLCDTVFEGKGGFVNVKKEEVERVMKGEIAGDFLQKFNGKQREALALEHATKEGSVVIQGPPGTGKSFLISSGILPQCLARGERVLVVCNSNCAVDAVAEKVVEKNPTYSSAIFNNKGITGGNNSGGMTIANPVSVRDKIVRVGYQQKVAKSVQPYFMQDMGQAVSLVKSNNTKSVMFSTLHNASSGKNQTEEFKNDTFDTLIVDEAGQIEDTKLFILIKKVVSLKKVILIGDHKQLQPYVSEGVRKQGYGISTMERLLRGWVVSGLSDEGSNNVCHIMLEVQHRCPTTIRSLVSRLFYENKLADGAGIGKGLMLNVNGKPRLPTLIIFDLKFGDAAWNPWQRSIENCTEAEATKLVYDFLLNNTQADGTKNPLNPQPPRNLSSKDICILSPYNRHKNRLRTVVAGIPEDMWHKFENLDTDTPLDDPSLDDRTVRARNIDTVDKFQGSEREVVIINPVVNGPAADRAGDPHFINVAMSRSKAMLVLVGRVAAISDLHWTQILDYGYSCDQGAVWSCDGLMDVRNALGEIGKGNFGVGNVRPVAGAGDGAGTKGSGEGEPAAKRMKVEN